MRDAGRVTSDAWRVARGMGRVTRGAWRVTSDAWRVARGAECLTAIVLAATVGACHRKPRFDPAEAQLAAAASESLTVALADSLAPGQGFSVSQAGSAVGALSACDDHGDSHGWQSVGSSIVEMELPPGFNSSGQTSSSARWSGPSGSISASAHRGGMHSSYSGMITSECDVFISGWPAHLDLWSTSYGRGVNVVIKPNDAPAIEIEAIAKTIEAQAQLLHAIRTARISSAWGRS